MWFGYKDEHNWHALDVDRVNHILELNQKGKLPSGLMEDNLEETGESAKLNADLEAMDRKFTKGRKKKKKKKRKKHRNKGPKGHNKGHS